MFLLEPDDLCPVCGETVGVCPHFRGGMRLRFWTTLDSTISFPSNTFVSVSRYDREKRVVESDLVIDLDNVPLDVVREAYQAVSHYAERPLLYHSGNKGFHIVVSWESLGLPPGDWTRHYEAFVQSLGIPYDPAPFRYRALIRVPGSVNWKTGYRKRLLTLDQLEDCLDPKVEARYSSGSAERLGAVLQSLDIASSKPTVSANYDVEDDRWIKLTKILPPCVESLYTHGIPAPGTRNQVYHLLASYYRARGMSFEEATSMLEEYALLHSVNTRTPEYARLKAARSTVRTVYGNRHKFSCREARELGLCVETCPLWKGSST